MTVALQTRLAIDPEKLCVLLNTHCVRAMLEIDEDETLALAKMDWGFDISSGDSRSIDLRVLPATVSNARQHGFATRLDWDWERVAKYLLRGAVKTVRVQRGFAFASSPIDFIEGTTAAMILNCSSTHFMNLLAASRLRKVPGTHHSTGPNGTPKITVESFLEFLRSRRVR